MKIELNEIGKRLETMLEKTPVEANRLKAKINKEIEKIKAINNRNVFSVISNVLNKKEESKAYLKRFEDIEATHKQVVHLNKRINRTRKIQDQFKEVLSEIDTLDRDDGIKKFIDFYFQYNENKEIRLIKIIQDTDNDLKIRSGSKENELITNELNLHMGSVNRLKRLDEYKKEYPKFSSFDEFYEKLKILACEEDEVKIKQVHDEIDDELGVFLKELKKKYPKISKGTRDDLRKITNWIRVFKQLDDRLFEQEEVKKLEQENILLIRKHNDYSRNGQNNEDKLGKLDVETCDLLEKVISLQNSHRNEKLSKVKVLFSEIKRHTEIEKLQEEFETLNIPVETDSDFEKWISKHKGFSRNFDNYIEEKKHILIDALEEKLRYSITEIKKIKDGPCSADVESITIVLSKRIDKIKQVGRTDSKETIITSLMEVKKVETEVIKISEKAQEERLAYQIRVEELENKAFALDLLIKKSNLKFDTVSTDTKDRIDRIDPGSISDAMSVLDDINDDLHKMENLFEDECLKAIEVEYVRIKEVNELFSILSVEHDNFIMNECDVSENLLRITNYKNNITNKLQDNIELFDNKKNHVISKLEKLLILSDTSNFEKDSLKQLVLNMQMHEINTNTPVSSLRSLNDCIVRAEQKIKRHEIAKVKAQGYSKILKERINELNSEYDEKYFPKVRKMINGMILGADSASSQWELVNSQLSSADSILKNLEQECRRLVLEEYLNNRTLLKKYITKYHKSQNKPQDYDEVIKLENTLVDLKGTFPSLKHRLDLENLLMRLI